MINIDKLERRFGRFAIPNLTLLLVASQSLCFILVSLEPTFISDLLLIPAAVRNGEIWRFITFLVVPPHQNVVFVLFALYIFYITGKALEDEWGAFKYNLYIAIAYLATMIGVFIGSVPVASNLYIASSVFLAFAYLNPEIEFLLFLVVPVKVKYLAMFTWGIYGLQLLFGSDSERILIVASITNFALFFGREVYDNLHARQRRMEFDAQRDELQIRTLHRCEVCGITEQTNNNMIFRVCSQCTDGREYCSDHIKEHNHR